MPTLSEMPTKTAGRPAKLSHTQVLDAALALLNESCGQDISMRQLAQRLNTVPANVYTYFASKEALLDSLAEYALSSLAIELNPVLEWDGQIAQWMESFRQALKTRPELLFLVGVAGTSPSMLRKIQRIAQLMQNAGLDAARAVHHAQGLLWTVMSFTFFEMQASEAKVIQQLRQNGEHDECRDVMQYLAVDNLEPLWRTTLMRNIDGIRLQLEKLHG